jgi:hypothetical protein
MSENKSTSTYVLPSVVTTATRTWITATVRAEDSAKVRDAKFLASVVSGYGTDLTPENKASMSGAVKRYITERKGASASHAATASKIVSRAWYTVGLRSVGVDVDTLGKVKVGDTMREALAVVINGEGGAALKPFRTAVTDAAKAGKWADIPALVAAPPVAVAATPDTDKDAQKDENGTTTPVATASDLSARNLGDLLRSLAVAVSESAVEYNPTDAEFLGDAITALESAIGTRVTAPAAA